MDNGCDDDDDIVHIESILLYQTFFNVNMYLNYELLSEHFAIVVYQTLKKIDR